LPLGEGAISDFLRPNNNRLLVAISDLSDSEVKALRKGQMRAGLLSKNGAILFLWQFSDKGKKVLTIDSPFDARLIPDIQLYNVETSETRLSVDVHIVDMATKIVRGLRTITMPPGLTIEFLAAVQDQLTDFKNGDEQLQKWMEKAPHELTNNTQMFLMGS
jgi:hypothetical protein